MASRRGSFNQSTNLIRQRIKAAADRRAIKKGKLTIDGLDQIIDATMDAAIGIRVERPDANAPGGIKVYEQPPDVAAAKALLDQMFGRAKETVEIQDPNEKFKHSPQVILVPPMSFIKKDGHD